MSKVQIFSLYILMDLAIVGGVVWCAFHHIPVVQYLLPASALFVLSGIWLVVMTLRSTPRL